jgi:hypothetical protein
MVIMMKPVAMMKIIVIVMEVKVARGIAIIIIVIRVIVIPIGGVVPYTTGQRQCRQKHKRY